MTSSVETLDSKSGLNKKAPSNGVFPKLQFLEFLLCTGSGGYDFREAEDYSVATDLNFIVSLF